MRLRDCQCDKPECPECGPLVALAQQIRQEFEHTTRAARVPTPEIVWWRAQMRARLHDPSCLRRRLRLRR